MSLEFIKKVNSTIKDFGSGMWIIMAITVVAVIAIVYVIHSTEGRNVSDILMKGWDILVVPIVGYSVLIALHKVLSKISKQLDKLGRDDD